MQPWVHNAFELLVRTTNNGVDAMNRRFGGTRFLCPVCDRRGTFSTAFTPTGVRRHARCPRCGALERHRLQAHVIDTVIAPRFAGRQPRVLHVAPESGLAPRLQALAGMYLTADAAMSGVDRHIDLRSMPFEDASFDIVYASHVLEHVDDDAAAVREIRRVLGPGGVAVLPVPIVGAHTVEYGEANPFEALHVRAPGADYYDRYRNHFARVEVTWSHDAPSSIQPYVLEDRSGWPTRTMPKREPTLGAVHEDAVPLCWV
jgi:SAM-dependent methyltransferase